LDWCILMRSRSELITITDVYHDTVLVQIEN